MISPVMEAYIPKLTETSLFQKFDQTSQLADAIRSEIKGSKETLVSNDTLKEIFALIRLNGDVLAKKAVDAALKGEIKIIFNKATSKIPPSLPYIVLRENTKLVAYIFADKVVNNITAASEYVNLMTVMEAAYIAMAMQKEPNVFTMNSQLMLTLCNIYTLMVIAPLEQRLYMKGDNLTKAMIYVITHFYNMFRPDDSLTHDSIPFRRLLQDTPDPSIINPIMDDVISNSDKSFMGLLSMIKKINPLRYKNIDSMYMTYFTSTCGVSLIFALENISYLFLLVSSATYKSGITAYSLNKTAIMPCKKAITILSTMNLE
jgi:hypothetical protein